MKKDKIKPVDSNQENDRVSSLKLLTPLKQLQMFSFSEKNSDLLFLIEKNKPIKYLIDLIEKCKEEIEAELVYNIGVNIAKVNMSTTEGRTQVNVKEKNDSNPILGVQIVELCFNLPKINEKHFIFSGLLYQSQNMLEKSLEIYLKALKKGIITPSVFSGVFSCAHLLGKTHLISEYLEPLLDKKEIIENPYSLSNIIYHFNRQGEKGDKEASQMAIQLTKAYWNKLCIHMKETQLASLYINLSDTFIVAHIIDETFTNIINEAISIIKNSPNYFDPHLALMFENIACFFGIMGNIEKTIEYLKNAKKNGHPSFQNLKELKAFTDFKEHKTFLNLFQ